jgi:serine/threonine protein kinase
MAPERLADHPTDDARADTYALTCVLYECLTGQPPFDRASVGSLVAAHLHTPPPRPSTSQPNVSAQLDAVIGTKARRPRCGRTPSSLDPDPDFDAFSQDRGIRRISTQHTPGLYRPKRRQE